MKIFKCIILIIFLLPTILKADVIYDPYTKWGFVYSMEAIGSYEIPLTKLNTVNFWGGIGGVSAIGELKHPAFGAEIAIELRQYFSFDKFKGFNIGFYSGFAFMRYPHLYHIISYHNSVGFVPGLKLTYKIRFNEWLIGEPYFSISTPIYSDDTENILKISIKDLGFIATVGLRIGFNKVRIKDK